jgi:predicted DNA-binding WGR domain protein
MSKPFACSFGSEYQVLGDAFYPDAGPPHLTDHASPFCDAWCAPKPYVQFIDLMNQSSQIDSRFALVIGCGAWQHPGMEETPSEILLKSIDHQRNRARFYALSIQPTLFGELSLVRQWGRIGSLGQYKLEFHPTAESAYRAMLRLVAAKRRRGYR